VTQELPTQTVARRALGSAVRRREPSSHYGHNRMFDLLLIKVGAT
jgi:hypothetical protein